jgi:hypothetical protein
MQLSATTLAQLELDLETARNQLTQGQLDPAVDPSTKLLAAAIAQAGAEIALALAPPDEDGSA